MGTTNDPKPLTLEELIRLADELKLDDRYHFACGWQAIHEMSAKLGRPPSRLLVSSDIWQQLVPLVKPTSMDGLAASISMQAGVRIEEFTQLPQSAAIGEWGDPVFAKSAQFAPSTPMYTGLALETPPAYPCPNKETK